MTLSQMPDPVVREPDWSRLLPRRLERESAAEHWRSITSEMDRQQTLSPTNGHAILRLVLARVMHDRAAAKAMRGGPVNEPAKGNTRAIPRPSLYFAAMREAAAMAVQIEAELGLSPRTRNRVGTVPQPRRTTGADRYLRSVPSLRPPAPDLNPLPHLSSTPEKDPTNER